jgi:hypothetical protein
MATSDPKRTFIDPRLNVCIPECAHIISFPIGVAELATRITAYHQFQRVRSPESNQLIPPRFLSMLSFVLTFWHISAVEIGS